MFSDDGFYVYGIYVCLFYYSDRYNIYKYTISIIGEDSISSLFMAYQLLLSIGIVKITRKDIYLYYIHCCELTVPAVSWVLRHKVGYM